MAAILACPWPAEAQPAVTPAVIKDARIAEALHRWSSEAGSFWQVAPGFVGRETVHQKALKKGKGSDLIKQNDDLIDKYRAALGDINQKLATINTGAPQDHRLARSARPAASGGIRKRWRPWPRSE